MFFWLVVLAYLGVAAWKASVSYKATPSVWRAAKDGLLWPLWTAVALATKWGWLKSAS